MRGTESGKPEPDTEATGSVARAELPPGRVLGMVGMALNLGPVVGVVVAAWQFLPGLYEAAQTGEATEELAEYFRQALMSTLSGVVVGLIGLGIVIRALVGPRLREPWFFLCGMIAAALWSFLMFPLGLLPGVFLFVQFLGRRDEFYSNDVRETPSS